MMAKPKQMEVIMRIDFAASNGIEVIAHAEKVQELVRCKDCKHRNGSACDYSAVWLRENGFCQWGERREDAES